MSVAAVAEFPEVFKRVFNASGLRTILVDPADVFYLQ